MTREVKQLFQLNDEFSKRLLIRFIFMIEPILNGRYSHWSRTNERTNAQTKQTKGQKKRGLLLLATVGALTTLIGRSPPEPSFSPLVQPLSVLSRRKVFKTADGTAVNQEEHARRH